MALVSRGLACRGCRQAVLQSFVGNTGVLSVQHSMQSRQTRVFFTPLTAWHPARASMQQEDKAAPVLNDINDTYADASAATWKREAAATDSLSETDPQSDIAEDFAPSQNKFVPWYVEVEQQAQPQENVISARQKVPDLPLHPPDILQPLLVQISVHLGMDDLSLLDLRGIDPPPALGANLVMIVGTARSEKHLHFSADKLCRWLRSEYKLTPYADGLLGRQELKLKMRRRAKRSSLLSAVGAKSTADTELEEGIRTGWICVNVGKVQGGELPSSDARLVRDKHIVGFGAATRGSNIVVQLLTEEKRGEVDLERLWTAILTKSRREKEALEHVDLGGHEASSVAVGTPLPESTQA